MKSPIVNVFGCLTEFAIVGSELARQPSPKAIEKRKEILRKALGLISEEGFRNQSLRAIGKSIGIDAAHILYYFESANDLFVNLLMLTDTDAVPTTTKELNLLDELERILRRNADSQEILLLYFFLLGRSFEGDAIVTPFITRRFKIVREGLAQAIRQEQTDGTMPQDLNPDRCARQLIALADGLQMQAALDPDINAADDLQNAIYGLRTRRAMLK